MQIMPNRMDREFFKHQDEYEKKALEEGFSLNIYG